MRFLTLIAVLAILAAGGYWWWTTTPQYSLEQVKVAIKDHDLEKFNKYVDLDSTSSRIVDDLLAKPMREALGPSVLGQVLVTGFVGLLRRPLADGIKQEIVNFVDSGSFRGKEATVGGPAGVSLSNFDDHLGFRKHAFRGITSSRIDGDYAQLEVSLHNEQFDQDLPLDVTMHKMSGYWQVVQLSNFQSFCGKLAQLEASQRQAPAASGAPERQGI